MENLKENDELEETIKTKKTETIENTQFLGNRMNWLNIKRTKEEVNLMSPLIWAYIGDCVYEIYIRTKLINENVECGIVDDLLIKVIDAPVEKRKLSLGRTKGSFTHESR